MKTNKPNSTDTLNFIKHLINSDKYSNEEILDLTIAFRKGEVFSSH